jgi:phosphoserine phosphatase RsbU/P
MKALVADDDAVFRLVLAQALTGLGHEVTVADSGGQAWRIFQSQTVPLLFTDWVMPDLDGPALCRLVRGERRAEYTYIVLITSLAGRASYLEGMEAGADDFVTKPFDREELLARLRVAERVLALQSRVDRLEQLLPICVYCKRIQDEGEEWSRVEDYIRRRTRDALTHGICPGCYETVAKPEVMRARRPGSGA